MDSYLEAYKKYATFEGRSTRTELWTFVLVNLVIYYVLAFISQTYNLGSVALLAIIFRLATLIPTIAVGVRRVHDVNKSGWFILVPIYNLILYCTPGTAGDNRFGPAPVAAPVKMN